VVVSSYISPKARKGVASAIAGRGLVAVAPIARDDVVAIKGGHIVDTATLDSLPELLRNTDVQIADGFYLAALNEDEYEPVMLFINHSCEPNVGFAGNIVLVAYGNYFSSYLQRKIIGGPLTQAPRPPH
jgi:uncharacterized protein